jgi:hypothetical protein
LFFRDQINHAHVRSFAMLVRGSMLAVAIVALSLSVHAADSPDKSGSNPLKYHDDTADGKKSLGGSGEMIHFTLPEAGKIGGIRIHGSRYGLAKPPKEKFLIYFLDGKHDEVLQTRMAPYSAFQRGDEEWVTISFPKPVEVPKDFWLCLDFRAHQTKGVYVSYDTSTEGKHSKSGLPGIEPENVTFGGDWMIELLPAK